MTTKGRWTYDGINPHFNVLPVAKVHTLTNPTFATEIEALEDLIGALESQRYELALQIAGHKRRRRQLRAHPQSRRSG